MSILLVEDELAHAFMIKSALEECGHELVHVSTIKGAIHELQSRDVDLILSDLNLDDAKGVETVKCLRGVTAVVPIVVLTASTSLREAVDAMRAGAEDFVIKEFDENFTDVLKFSVLRTLDKSQTQAEQVRLLREREWLERAIEYGQDGLAVVVEGGRCSYCNSAFLEISQTCGFDLEQFFSVLDQGKVKDGVRVAGQLRDGLDVVSPGAVFSFEVQPALGSQDETYECSISVPTLGEMEQEGWVAPPYRIVRVRNVSADRRKERFQREMLSATSHDLKGPLSAISLSAELLAQIKDEAKREDIRLRIASLAKSCQNLVEELLSAASIRAGAMTVNPKQVEVPPLVARCLDEFKPIADSRGISLSFKQECLYKERAGAAGMEGGATSKSQSSWSLDTLAFGRMLSNLLGNAIKYTPKGGSVVVVVKYLEERLEVSVRDTGKGIDPSKLAFIFEPYARLERDLSKGGHGLGLFVTKSLISAHGGSLSVESVLGKGSCFTLLFPLKYSDPAASA